ncbi:MAG: group II intron reverse transcriptase/maturase [bacterium]|nr:group II intron reverse transcriptase/maturase [bacterium]
MALMVQAFRTVKASRGAPGSDGVSIASFEANLQQNLSALMADLKQRHQYQPLPLRRVYIPKGKGQFRPLGIPAVRDRVAQAVVKALLEPIFEPTFSNFSFGFRPLRNQHQAVESVLRFRDEGLTFVLDADISACFDNIDHDLVIDLIAHRVADGNILNLVRQFLTAGVLENGVLQAVDKGSPQGGVISPLLANIVLHQLDLALTQSNFRFVRFADDFLVFCSSLPLAHQALAFVDTFLQEHLSLHLSPTKTKVTTFFKGFEFLGFRFSARYVSIRQKSLVKLKDNIRSLTIRSHNFGPATIQLVNRIISGFAHYFDTPFSDVKTQLHRLDQWLRKRLRCMKFKRISRFDNRRFLIKHLHRLGLRSFSDFVEQS